MSTSSSSIDSIGTLRKKGNTQNFKKTHYVDQKPRVSKVMSIGSGLHFHSLLLIIMMQMPRPATIWTFETIGKIPLTILNRCKINGQVHASSKFTHALNNGMIFKINVDIGCLSRFISLMYHFFELKIV